MTEKAIQSAIMAKCGSLPNVRLFRNTVGVGWVGHPFAPTKITFGLQPGSADLIGWRTLRITPDMVGRDIAQFVSIEVKRPGGKLSDAQRNWRFRVHDAGGFALVTDSPNSALACLIDNNP